MTTAPNKSSLAYVIGKDGRSCGFTWRRRHDVEAFTDSQVSIGTYGDQTAAVEAIIARSKQ